MQRLAPILLLIGSVGLGALLWTVFGMSSGDPSNAMSQITLDPLDLEYEEVFPGGDEWEVDFDEGEEDEQSQNEEGEENEEEEDAQVDKWLGSKLTAASREVRRNLQVSEETETGDNSESTPGSSSPSTLTQEVEGILAELREKRNAARKISRERKNLRNRLKVLNKVSKKLKFEDHDKQRLQELTLENQAANLAIQGQGLPKAQIRQAKKELNERFKQDVSQVIGEDTTKKYFELTKRFSNPDYATKKKFKSLTNRIKKLEKLVSDLSKGQPVPQ